jgi:biopolymer transport protein ExbD
MNLHPRRAEEPEVSIISLIDVVLMLLIFFMLSTSFVHPSRIHVTLPHASATAVPRPAAITITVTRTGTFLVNNRALVNSRSQTLRAALLKVAGDKRNLPVMVRADAHATTQSMVTVMDVAGSLGFSHINIMTTHGGGS